MELRLEWADACCGMPGLAPMLYDEKLVQKKLEV